MSLVSLQKNVQNESRRLLEIVLISGVFGVGIGSLVARVRFGVDFTDDSLYAALPYSFFLGARPFVDELSMYQGFGLFVVPFVALHQALVGSAEGLVLFLRFCFVAIWCVGGFGIFRLLRLYPAISPLLAGIAAAVFVAHVPYVIPALSYITVTILFLTLSLFSLWVGTEVRSTRLVILGAGLLSAAVIAYPTVAVVWITEFLIFGFMYWRSRERQQLTNCACFVGFGIVVATIYLLLGLDNIAEAYRFHSAFGGHGGGGEKLQLIANGLSTLVSSNYGLTFVGAICATSILCWLISSAFPLALLGGVWCWHLHAGSIDGGYNHQFVSGFCLITIVSGFIQAMLDSRYQPLAWIVVAPSLIGGIITAWTSASAFGSFFIGSAPSLIVFPLLLFWAPPPITWIRRVGQLCGLIHHRHID